MISVQVWLLGVSSNAAMHSRNGRYSFARSFQAVVEVELLLDTQTSLGLPTYAVSSEVQYYNTVPDSRLQTVYRMNKKDTRNVSKTLQIDVAQSTVNILNIIYLKIDIIFHMFHKWTTLPKKRFLCKKNTEQA